MMELPDEIKQTFFKMMIAQMELADFEQWVYNSRELERALSEDAYLQLISFNYKKIAAQYELFRILQEYTDAGEYETFKLMNLLNKAKLRNLELPAVLEQFYNLYCHGYEFLDNLGIGFGLSMCVLPSPYKVEHWSDLTLNELTDLVGNLSPLLDVEIVKVESWLTQGKIVLTREQDELAHYKHIDNRTNEEKSLKPLLRIFK